ncbi:molybdopterin oxidoreductase family protein [Paractinoplanes brasiliensis]|uniref:Anaerobic selenocysteine-containing dehydrogenase n=1 Tax=Paractinoplanes brasiliensis TaxID=52695 RepID=A0A4R6JBE6_9ACTN|nr:molybdopterin oxidoreductase family protein [Actinoplanes brasiliensis]TDO31806.1 anaerobic selenocysteine-containing dehydrogenase [Actinoplanes brasiliensis]GID30596.1 dehydrogenase [Actinoplanes brasiliensis]
MADSRTAYRTCPFCEAACGLELTLAGDTVIAARGDREHVFSHGFICPKGATFGRIDDDPDRLRRPVVKRGGAHVEVDWEEAFEVVAAGLRPVLDTYGPNAVALYLGNPNVHTMAGGLYVTPLVKTLGSRNVFSASTVDQMPKHVSSGHLFGSPLTIPVPDLDRTDLLLMLGANPWESNGSLATAADFPGRLKAIQARGGKFVVVDPRRTRTAAHADEHLFIRPGADAYLLFGIVHTLFADGLVSLGALAGQVNGVETVGELAASFAPSAVSEVCGVPAERIRALAHELAAAPRAVVYGRIGTCTVEFGTLTSWLVDVINVLTGNLDRPGGAMFPLAPHVRKGRGAGKGFRTGRWHSRVRRLPEVKGELPVATLADEIETPGDEQVRAFITVAGNPVLSTPNSGRLDKALAGLSFMVSVDPYLNETTRHADVVLPPPDALRKGHYDFSFLGLAVRNFATYSPPVVAFDGPDECDILARLTLIVSGKPGTADDVHEAMLRQAGAASASGSSPAERLLDAALRSGPYEGMSLDLLLSNPHGVDLGPLQPRIPEVLRTPSGKVELDFDGLAAEVTRLRAALDRPRDTMVLIGRRHLRSNNSWMHNVPALVKGRDRCTLQINPADAARLDLRDGDDAQVTSRAGGLSARVEVTDAVMPGVVSLPHGWGHGLPGSRMTVAAEHPGVNSNILTDETTVDPLSGNSVLNGIPVEIKALAVRD